MSNRAPIGRVWIPEKGYLTEGLWAIIEDYRIILHSWMEEWNHIEDAIFERCILRQDADEKWIHVGDIWQYPGGDRGEVVERNGTFWVKKGETLYQVPWIEGRIVGNVHEEVRE